MRSIYSVIPLVYLAAIGCGGGGGGTTSNFQQSVPQISVSVRPAKALTPVGTMQPFSAILSGGFAAVKWTATAGTIDQFGNYTAPLTVPAGGIAKVTATTKTSPVVSGSAIVTITTQPVTISISPSMATVKAGFSASYIAHVSGTTNTFANWSVSPLPGDTTYPGTVGGGYYLAPSPFMSPDTFQISAASAADPTKTASATVNVIPLENQVQQTFPIRLGTSGINALVSDCCTGTLGALLVDQNGKEYILSNNHVIGRVGHAKAGDSIVQPGYVDTFCDSTMPKPVANFTYAPPIQTSNVDAAIAQVIAGAVDAQGEIIGLGGVAGDGSYIPAAPASTTANAVVGMAIAKSGRTTGLSCGNVVGISAKVCVDYAPDCGNTIKTTVCYTGQVIVGSGVVRPGDSGSLIVNANTSQPVGLTVGGSSDGRFASANPVGNILTALKTGTGSTFRFVGGGQHPVACGGTRAVSRRAMLGEPSIPDDEIAHAIDVRKRNESALMADAAVIATAVGSDDMSPAHASLLIFVERGKITHRLPGAVEGVSVRVIPTGRFQANPQLPAKSPACRHRNGGI